MVELKIYCGPDKFYGPSKFGQYDGIKNRAPLLITSSAGALYIVVVKGNDEGQRRGF